MAESLYVFGTGNAGAVNCYNTCFALRKEDEYLMVDAGGGNGILRILRDMNVPMSAIHHMIVTHEHTDHVLGVVWMVRMIATAMLQGKYEGNLHIYGHEELLGKVRTLCALTLQKKHCAVFDDRILFEVVADGESRQALGYDITFFDIHSTKAPQFGFSLKLESGETFTCLGDEPYNPLCKIYAEHADWLLSEAFCLYEDRERFKPYEKHHSTAKDGAQQAAELGVKNLVLWHTEDSNLAHRKARYTAEAAAYFSGNILVPDDREIIPLSASAAKDGAQNTAQGPAQKNREKESCGMESIKVGFLKVTCKGVRGEGALRYAAFRAENSTVRNLYLSLDSANGRAQSSEILKLEPGTAEENAKFAVVLPEQEWQKDSITLVLSQRDRVLNPDYDAQMEAHQENVDVPEPPKYFFKISEKVAVTVPLR
ncbi:MAG: MBL fold metallo-hydrolase [Clostridiales bacterium]|nr:MBL fold metallo-hydrolase [Clostridiales bacterium]